MVNAWAADQERRDELAAAHPGWCVWGTRRDDGRTGLWIARRHRNLSDDELYGGLHKTLIGDNADELAAGLAEQAARERAIREMRGQR
jgi:hypothetical protein